jgi:uncharacterized membrane protein YqhA
MPELFLLIGKYFIIAGTTAILIASAVLIVWSLANLGKKIILVFKDVFQPASQGTKRFDIEIISIVDDILVAVLLYLVSAGLFVLFYGKHVTPEWLEWLEVGNIYDLKDLILGMIIVILAIAFLEHLMEWKDGKNTLHFGLAIAVIILALTFYVTSRFIIPHAP